MSTICTIEGCNKPTRARGLCTKHHQRWAKHGDPLATEVIVCSTPEESFRLRTRWDGDCLIWTGATNGRGYGQIAVNGGKMYAHRYSWAQRHGRWPSRYEEVRHRCDNPPCVNPDHLVIGAHKDNMEDMAKRGRNRRLTCKNGHPWTEEHVFYRATGERYCRTCKDAARKVADKQRWTCPLCGSNIVRRTRNAHLRNVHAVDAFAEHLAEVGA